ncbi:MAG TPA: hypothetical protein VLN09_02825, partial [Psychrobacter sp.]|uniref:hypothetical protein n=1 Tax=Psychrobacter sp. TaxID=56811 RepID=UPI002BF655FB
FLPNLQERLLSDLGLHFPPYKLDFFSQFRKSDHLFKGVLYRVANAGEGIIEHRKNERGITRRVWNIHKLFQLCSVYFV